MARELEIIGAGAMGGLLRRKPRHAPGPGTLCLNCGTELQGAYCHVCGQEAGTHHRHIGHVIWDGIEGMTHLDGRLGQTLPPLFFDPGRLARDQLEGRRQRHVPPFRLFLVSLLIFMVVLEGLFHGATHAQHGQDGHAITLGPAKQTAAPQPGASPRSTLPPPKTAKGQFVIFSADDGDASSAAEAMDKAGKGPKDPFGRWMTDHIKRAAANKEYYTLVLFTWAHRLAILLLPILAGLLALVYVRRRRQFYLYDHLTVAMQFLSFEFLVFAVSCILPEPFMEWAMLIAILWSPLNLYMILRGAYGSRRITAAFKAALLWFSTLLLFSVLMVGLMGLALAEM